MQTINLALMLLSSISIAVCHHKRDAYRKHVNITSRYPCSNPKPRVIELEEVVPEDILNDKFEGLREKIKPAVTILHTCNSTGCCEKPDERCAPNTTQDVTLTFAVFHAKSIEYFSVNATNHTSCSCRSDYHNFDNAIK